MVEWFGVARTILAHTQFGVMQTIDTPLSGRPTKPRCSIYLQQEGETAPQLRQYVLHSTWTHCHLAKSASCVWGGGEGGGSRMVLAKHLTS